MTDNFTVHKGQAKNAETSQASTDPVALPPWVHPESGYAAELRAGTVPAGPFRLFTFGVDHLEKYGLRANACAVFTGEGDQPRAKMFQRFGRDWAFDYAPPAALDQIGRYGYVPLAESEMPPITRQPADIQRWIEQTLTSPTGWPARSQGDALATPPAEITWENSRYPEDSDHQPAGAVHADISESDLLGTAVAAQVASTGTAPSKDVMDYLAGVTDALDQPDGLALFDEGYSINLATGTVLRAQNPGLPATVQPGDPDFRQAMLSVHTGYCGLAWNHRGRCMSGAEDSVHPAEQGAPETARTLTAKRHDSLLILDGQRLAVGFSFNRAVTGPDFWNRQGHTVEQSRLALRAYADWLMAVAELPERAIYTAG